MKTEPTEALELKKSIQYGLGIIDAGSGILSELSSMVDDVVNIAFSEGQSSPKIKQLEWVEVCGGYEDAKTPFGHYVVRPSIVNKTFIMIDLRKGIEPYSTLNEAKVAAQRDFEKRIKECLE